MPSVAKGSMTVTESREPCGGSDVERRTAAAAALLVGVGELEPLAHQRLLPLEDGAIEGDEALRGDSDSHPRAVVRGVLERTVTRVRRAVVNREKVGEPRAPATPDAEAQARLG